MRCSGHIARGADYDDYTVCPIRTAIKTDSHIDCRSSARISYSSPQNLESSPGKSRSVAHSALLVQATAYLATRHGVSDSGAPQRGVISATPPSAGSTADLSAGGTRTEPSACWWFSRMA